MARRLLAAGTELTVWNRSAGKADALVAAGAHVARTPREAAASVTLTVLTDLTDVESLLEGEEGLLAGWVGAAVPEPVLVVHGTVSPVRVAELARRLAAHGIAVVDAPVSGGVAGAEAGTLSVMVGGDDGAVGRVMPYFASMGRIVRHLGPVGSGQLAKACNQIVVGATITAVSEALVLADAAGLSRATVLELLGGGLANSEVLRQKQDRWLSDDYDGGGSSVNQLKDLRFVREAADDRRIRLPLADAVRKVFETAVTVDGEGDLDHAGILLSLRRHATPTGEATP